LFAQSEVGTVDGSNGSIPEGRRPAQYLLPSLGRYVPIEPCRCADRHCWQQNKPPSRRRRTPWRL